ncbi:c-type cytochrome [Maribacter sp. 2307ULW6-5]|uniref:c-type cytochrome n=1 Tax=Maribacter sp. 2307ULW6-5 TaxID=3386275 RepID=UPI0039BD14D5
MLQRSPFALIFSIFLLFSCGRSTETTSKENEEPVRFQLPDNFALEQLHHPSAVGQGSWVALAAAPGNTLYASDQRGKLYHIKLPELSGKMTPDDVVPLALNIGAAQGLLWAHNALYVAVNKNWDNGGQTTGESYGSGIYKLTDTTGDGSLDQVEMLLRLEGSGEHGPHSLVPSPDGKEIYFIAGNHTLVPEQIKKSSRVPLHWGEDNLFAPFLDARGHATDIKAPGGWIAKFTPDGSHWELVSAGYRNPFDLAFNPDGELFTYDSDMEWDIGMPWYRPTRICHVTSGSEYGWRTGSGKWPAYYPDNLPAVHNLEQGSPTAVLPGAALHFPPEYQNGLFVMDWSFGTVYHIDLEPQGSSYGASRKEFFSGAPLPLTDMVAGEDGHLYFATGGRGLDSRLYRLHYKGHLEPTAPTGNEEGKALRELRRSLEAHHSGEPNKNAIALAWQHLDHEDRFIRYAARLVLEHQPYALWKERWQREAAPTKQIEASIALARSGTPAEKQDLLTVLQGIPFQELKDREQLDFLRACSLSFIRMGDPGTAHKKNLVEKLGPHFPGKNRAINRELAQLLLYADAPGILDRLVQQLQHHTQQGTVGEEASLLSEETTLRSEQYGPLIREVIAQMPPSEAIFYGMLLSNATKGWTNALREDYFSWYFDVLDSKGGRSFKAYMEDVRQRALAQVPEAERTHYQELSGVYSPATDIADLPEPIGPGGNYSGDDMGSIVWGSPGTEPSFEAGKRAFAAGMCIVCHRMRGEGGASGPDLTQVHTKFGRGDLLYAIYSPNEDISDQYANTLFTMKDGKKLAGRIKSEGADGIVLMPNPFNENYTVTLNPEEVAERGLSPISPMPAGLLNRLNENEIRNLFAYVQAGGDATHEVYTKNQ